MAWTTGSGITGELAKERLACQVHCLSGGVLCGGVARGSILWRRWGVIVAVILLVETCAGPVSFLCSWHKVTFSVCQVT